MISALLAGDTVPQKGLVKSIMLDDQAPEECTNFQEAQANPVWVEAMKSRMSSIHGHGFWCVIGRAV